MSGPYSRHPVRPDMKCCPGAVSLDEQLKAVRDMAEVASPGLSVKRHGCQTTATEEVAARLKLEKWLELAISEFPEDPKVTGS